MRKCNSSPHPATLRPSESDSSMPTTTPSPAHRRDFFFLAALLLVALALRGYRLGSMNLWLDELLSLQTSNATGFVSQNLPTNVLIEHPPRLDSLAQAQPWSHIWQSLRRDEQLPPLYFLILRPWRVCFGDSEIALRSLSVIASCAAVAFLFLAAREFFGTAVAVWAALLMAISPMQIMFAQEARPYALATAALAAALAALARIDKRGLTAPRLLAFIIALATAVLTHYFSIGPAIAMGVYALLIMRGRRRLAALGAMLISAILFAIIGGGVFLAQRAQFHSKLSDFPTDTTHWKETLLRMLWAPVGQMVNVTFVPPWANCVIAIAIVAALCFAWRSRGLLLAALWILAGFGMLAFIDWTGGSSLLLIPRYSLMASVGLFLLIPAALSNRGRILPHLLPAIATIATLACVSTAYFNWKGNWKQTAATIQRHSPQREPLVILASPDRDWWLGRTLLGLRHYYRGPFPNVVLANPPLSASLTATLQKSPRIWLLVDTQLPEQKTWNAAPGLVVQHRHLVPNIGVLAHPSTTSTSQPK
jgi:uncharacterized membrane protein